MRDVTTGLKGMGESKSHALRLDHARFMAAFGRDWAFTDSHPQSFYLDRETGEFLWVFDSDDDAEWAGGFPAEENCAKREAIEARPNRYVEIPGLNHWTHHAMLREFLDSDWTEDEGARNMARNAYLGSIGGWRKAVEDDSIVYAYYDFRDRKVQEMAEEFLLHHGIKPLWE